MQGTILRVASSDMCGIGGLYLVCTQALKA